MLYGNNLWSEVDLTSTVSDRRPGRDSSYHQTPSISGRMSTGSAPEIEQEIAQLVVEIGQSLTNAYVNSEYAESPISSIWMSTECPIPVQCRQFASWFTTF